MTTPERTQRRLDVTSVEPLLVVPGARRPPRPVAEPAAGLPLSASLSDATSPSDVVDLLVLDAFATGREPFARSTHLENVLADAVLLPRTARVVREAVNDLGTARLAVGDGWTVRSAHWRSSRQASVTVTATSEHLAATVLAESVDGCVEAVTPTPDRVPMSFWHLSARGPRQVPRDVAAPPWSHIRRNYARRAATALDDLMRLTPDAVGGRLLLLHGPPGTGKTTLLRALARAWRSWCRVDCVLDSERLFESPSYLLEVALGDHDHDADSEGERWRLLLLEDCDELIRAEAKASSGQHLSRLLNLTDGLLGQGRRVLVAITTNEALGVLHPAVVRPGRCLAQVEVGRFPVREAAAWLDDAELATRVGPHGATLAELYALTGGTPSVMTAADDAPAATGLYL